jgi:hypothetical protein
LRPKGWLIDIWTLQDSWAFKEKLVRPVSFDQLVRTTFLNVEAIAVRITNRPGLPREIYTSGFFEAIAARVLDISFEPNPFPQLCVVRTFVSALRLNFAISPRLGKYLLQHTEKLPSRALIDIQQSHYGKIRISEGKMKEYLDHVAEQLSANSRAAIWLPTTGKEQLELSRYWSPSV